MADRHDSRSWDSFLPPAYNWLKSLQISATRPEKFAAGTWLALPVVYNKALDLSGLDLEKSLLDKIVEETGRVGWRGKSSVTVTVDGTQVVLVPVSKLDVSGNRKGREVGLSLAKIQKDHLVDTLVFCQSENLPLEAQMEGYFDGLYEMALFKEASPKTEFPKTISYLGEAADKDIRKAVALARASMFARTLQDAPANWLTPLKWAEIAYDHFNDKDVELKILGKKELEQENMGSFLSVAQGSPIEPKLISVKIKGRSSQKSISLVGKGLTFDAGGISLKPSAGMGEMKYDMSGGSAVMGAAHFLEECQPEHDVHCLIGAVENMPSGTATRPGDIVQSKNGKTIEILNTDAEGRLVLADVLAYAAEEKPDLIVDLATLTGAVLHGLGSAGAAVMSNKNQAAEGVIRIGKEAGEPLWQLPIWPELLKEVKSDVADLKNIAKPAVMAGTLMGAAFLNEFVPKDIPWVHMDIAGTGWSCSALGYPKTGGSGFGIRTITQLCFSDI